MDGSSSGDLRPLYFTTSNPHPAARRPQLQPYHDLRSVPGRARPYQGRPMDCTQPQPRDKPDSSPAPLPTETRAGPNRTKEERGGPSHHHYHHHTGGTGEHISRRDHRVQGHHVNTERMTRQGPMSPPQQMLSPPRHQTMSPTVISDLNRPVTSESDKMPRHGHDNIPMAYPSMGRHEGPPMSPGGYVNVPSHDGSTSPSPYSSMTRHDLPPMSPGYVNVPPSHSAYGNIPRHEGVHLPHSAYPGMHHPEMRHPEMHHPDISPMMSPSGYSNVPVMSPGGYINVPRQEDPNSTSSYSNMPRSECPPTYSNIPRHNGATAEEIITDAFRDIHRGGQTHGDKQTQSEVQTKRTGQNHEEHHEGISKSVQVSLPIPATSPCGCLTPPCASPIPMQSRSDDEIPDKSANDNLDDEMYKNDSDIFRPNIEPEEPMRKEEPEHEEENIHSSDVPGNNFSNEVQNKEELDTSSDPCKYCDGHPRDEQNVESSSKMYEDKGSVTSPDKEFTEPDTHGFKDTQTKGTNTKGKGNEEEDIVEEVYITGRFRNLRGYAERVQQLVEEKVPTPTKEEFTNFENSFKTEEQTSRADKAVGTEKEGVRFDDRNIERHVYDSQNVDIPAECTMPEEKIPSPLRETPHQNRHSVFSTISEKSYPEPVIEEVYEERSESDIQMCEMQVPESNLYKEMCNEPFPVTEHPEERARRSCDIPIETLTRSFSDEHLDDLKKYMKRPSALKYPGTIGRRKKKNLIVQFSDMCTCFDGEIQRSPFWERGIDREFAGFNPFHRPPPFPRRVLTPLFTEPGKQPGFLKKVKKQKVSMEKVIIGNDLSVCGIVRVINLAFEKRVYVRYSYDHWRNYNEAQASYILGSCDGYSDQFSFLLEADSLMDHDALIFCVRYRTVAQEYWDNNGGRNYVIKCFGASAGGASGAAKISEGYRGTGSYLQVPPY